MSKQNKKTLFQKNSKIDIVQQAKVNQYNNNPTNKQAN